MKLPSAKTLEANSASLQAVTIETAKASRPEDVAEILGRISDKEAFNHRLQNLIFANLLDCWYGLDLASKMRRAGSLIRMTEALSSSRFSRQVKDSVLPSG